MCIDALKTAFAIEMNFHNSGDFNYVSHSSNINEQSKAQSSQRGDINEMRSDSGREINARIELINQRSLARLYLTPHVLDFPSAIASVKRANFKSKVVRLDAGRTVTWMLFAICFLIANVTGLTGDHVCQEEERYIVNVTEYYPRNITVRSYQWCMQVPPRCSIFSYRIINESKIIEEERTRAIDICCDGYEPDPTQQKCELICKSKCLNGKCNEENKCYCDPGFRGDYCEKGCDPSRWGRYCRYHCDCQRGTCDPELGRCQCPPGWTGLKCEQQCHAGYFGRECSNICNCSADQICDPQDGHCTNKVKVAVLKKYHTFDTIPQKNSNLSAQTKQAKKVDLYLLTTEPSDVNYRNSFSSFPNSNSNVNTNPSINGYAKNLNASKLTTQGTTSTASTLITSTLPSVNDITKMHGKLTNAKEGVINSADKFSTSNQDPDDKSTPVVNNANKEIENLEVNIKSMDRTVMKSEIPLKGKAAQSEVVVNDSWNNHNRDGNVDIESASSSLGTKDFAEVDNEHATQTFNFATISFAAILFVAISGFLLAGLLKKRRESETPHVNKHIPKSIFHTPLPELPQSPFFDSPPSAHYHTRIGDNEVTQPRSSTTSNGLIETATTELPDGYYDQLPSTGGSYKAAMSLEPPPPPSEITRKNHADANEFVHCSVNLPAVECLENVYDEIPCWTRSTEHDALYINTRIENKTQF